MTDQDNVIPFPDGGRPDPRNRDSPADAEAVQEFLAQLLGTAGMPSGWLASAGFETRRHTPALLRKRAKRVAYVVRIDLDDARPPIWRRVRLASDLTLDHLHGILQVVMGWTDSHLHQFQMGPDSKDRRVEGFLTDFDLFEGETEGVHEGDVRLDQVLAKPGQRLFYWYDFGDSWHHTVKLEKVEPWVEGDPEARCVTGRRACPPEDVGGLYGYEEVVAALAGDLGDPPDWIREKLDWLPPGYDPAAFDAGEVNALLEASVPPDLGAWRVEVMDLLRRAGGSPLSAVGMLIGQASAEAVALSEAELAAATRRYVRLLEIVGPGISLTAAGYLPPRLVETLWADLGMESAWIGKGNREDQTWPILSLRQSATGMGLLRKANGRLLPTRAGQALMHDPRALFEHMRAKLPLGRREHERDAGLICLLLAASGKGMYEHRRDAAAGLAALGWHSEDLEAAAYASAEDTRVVLEHLAGEKPATEHTARIARALLNS